MTALPDPVGRQHTQAEAPHRFDVGPQVFAPGRGYLSGHYHPMPSAVDLASAGAVAIAASAFRYTQAWKTRRRRSPTCRGILKMGSRMKTSKKPPAAPSSATPSPTPPPKTTPNTTGSQSPTPRSPGRVIISGQVIPILMHLATTASPNLDGITFGDYRDAIQSDANCHDWQSA